MSGELGVNPFLRSLVLTVYLDPRRRVTRPLHLFVPIRLDWFPGSDSSIPESTIGTVVTCNNLNLALVPPIYGLNAVVERAIGRFAAAWRQAYFGFQGVLCPGSPMPVDSLLVMRVGTVTNLQESQKRPSVFSANPSFARGKESRAGDHGGRTSWRSMAGEGRQSVIHELRSCVHIATDPQRSERETRLSRIEVGARMGCGREFRHDIPGRRKQSREKRFSGEQPIRSGKQVWLALNHAAKRVDRPTPKEFERPAAGLVG
ncbi:hypothetical protein ANO11243_046670 [Dothideomycetidae sp. 11243]|nr:hypothetical protein ANO11243_046670 [fungal sp. No.11243]